MNRNLRAPGDPEDEEEEEDEDNDPDEEDEESEKDDEDEDDDEDDETGQIIQRGFRHSGQGSGTASLRGDGGSR